MAASTESFWMVRMRFCFNEEKAVRELIRKIINDMNPAKIVFCGSSKGGYAALNFGMDFKNAYMVVGAPQYYLTSYLNKSENFCTLEHIMGAKTSEKENILGYYLQNKIRSNKNSSTQKIFIHYSNMEHTYEEHIIHLLKDMRDENYNVEEDIADYSNHSDVSYYFPDFLRKKINEIVKQ